MTIIDRVLEPRLASLGGELQVRRVLPRGGRGVGPFIFLDHMGPWDHLPGGPSLDVPPHPHIGLATLTWLFDGELVHRDSLGTVRPIRPGDVNWMTAGSGVVHSERLPKEAKDRPLRLHGLQAWVALPKSVETMPATFSHHPASEIPEGHTAGARVRLIAGEVWGMRSPVPTHSSLFYAELVLDPGAHFNFSPGKAESAFYLLDGTLEVEGASIHAPNLVVFRPAVEIVFAASGPVKGVLLGGKSLGPRFIEWNFVATDRNLIEQAKERWRTQAFPKVPGETDFVPLPAVTVKSSRS